MNFSGARELSIDGNAILNVVHRDQNNYHHHHIRARVVKVARPVLVPGNRDRKIHKRREGDATDQYRELLRGDIYNVERVHSEDFYERKVQGDGRLVEPHIGRRAVHQVRIYGDDRAFTSISYHGEDAFKLWREDFTKYTQLSDSATLQLFGVNKSNIPALIFYDDWIPIGHIYRTGMFWTNVYFNLLSKSLQCDVTDLWLNMQRGHIASGPRGPPCNIACEQLLYTLRDVPTSVDMLKDDSMIKYLCNQETKYLDFDVLFHAYCGNIDSESTYIGGIQSCNECEEYEDDVDLPRPHYHCDFGDLDISFNTDPHYDILGSIESPRLDTVYSGAYDALARMRGNGMWRCQQGSGAFLEPTLMEGGWTRFKVSLEKFDEDQSFSFDFYSPHELAWLSQAYAVFNVHRDIDEESCFMIDAIVILELRRRQCRPHSSEFTSNGVLYLFIKSLPSWLSGFERWLNDHISFWSVEEDGSNQIAEMDCQYIGLPKVTPVDAAYSLTSWPKYSYEAIRRWQVARGFEPTTVDFARSCGYPSFELVLKKSEQIEEVVEEVLQDSSVVHGSTAEEEKPSWLGRWWSWTATPGSDISAFAV
ncbi:hypothetical protein VNI00_000506 [Paramarasmius palmivorus]|uniref:Uncharacterized protein n=1 Tax=Paramarasmius palmivorus TaxID=297713 RepID=A0AAW0E8G5_9AGAR